VTDGVNHSSSLGFMYVLCAWEFVIASLLGFYLHVNTDVSMIAPVV